MIVVPYAGRFENDLLLVADIVAILVRQQPDIWRCTYDDLGALRLRQNTDPERICQFGALEKRLRLVRLTVAIRVLENNDTITLRPNLAVLAIVYTLHRPHAILVINVDVRRIHDHWLRGNERCLEPGSRRKSRHVRLRFFQTIAIGSSPSFFYG